MSKDINIIEYIKSLGWVFSEYWNNRVIYELDKYPDCSYVLFEHQGEIGILHDGQFKYYNLKEKDIKEFTEVLNTKEMIMCNPDDYTVRELFNVCTRLDDILSEFAIKKFAKDNQEILNDPSMIKIVDEDRLKDYTFNSSVG